MAISDGDILSALQNLQSDTSKISQTISDMSQQDIHRIQKDLETLVRQSQGTQRSAENDRFRRERDKRARDRQSRQTYSQGTSRFGSSSYSSGSRSRSYSSRSFSSSFDGVVDEFASNFSKGISEQLKKSLNNSPLQKQIQGFIKQFADDLGIKVSEIPSALGRDLGKYVIQNTKFGQNITATLQNYQDRILKSLINTAKGGVARHNQANPGNTFQDMYNRYTKRYRSEHSSSSESAEFRSRRPQAPSESSGFSDSGVSLLQQINDSVFAILNHLDATAAEGVRARSNEPQGARRGPSSGQPEGPQGPSSSEGPRFSEEGYDPNFDLFNNIKNRAQKVYDRLPENLKSKISDKYGDYINKFKNLGNQAGDQASSIVGDLGGEASASVGEAAAGAEASTTALASTGSELAVVGESTMAAEGAAVGSTALAGTAGTTAASIGMAIPEVAIALAAIYVVTQAIEKFAECFTPAIEGLNKFSESAKKASNRFWESQHEMLKEERKRIEADIKTMAETPFNIMNDAAQKWYDAWDNQLKKIGQTQGYNKSDMQTLYSGFAERLRSEGLSSAVSATDIAASLGSVLESGLSGKVAEEFAYKATLLNNQIPTQDFFSYASTYGQLVGNAMARGLSESAAIQEANAHLEQFASNLLYAGRNISQGIATGLKDGSQIFADSVNIALASRTGNPDTISAVTTAVAAELSAIAPDLTSEVLQKVLAAATGGNSSELVALRSMAGIDAGNTAFLTAMATNPQSVIAAMFSGLAKMQKIDTDNYMEVAEGLSQTFGISAAAFQRIDFEGLAQAVTAMQVNQSALSENLNLLKSGETTPGPEALRAQQINKMILDEGLAYVLDNEAARAIQQHMWDQELANEIMEREYSVDLTGSAKEAIQGIFETVHNILKFLNPFSWIGDIVGVLATSTEYSAQMADLRAIIEAGKVGTGNTLSFRNLTNYNGATLNSVPSLLSMLGVGSQYDATHGGISAINAITEGSGFGALQLGTQSLGDLNAGLSAALSSSQSSVSSKYTWGFIGKSIAKAIASTPMSTSSGSSTVMSSSDSIRKNEATRMNQILGSMDAAIAANKSYDEWKSEVTKQYKLTDFSQALSQVNLSESQVRGQFDAKEAQKVSKHNYEREQVEDEFWEKAINYYDVSFPEFAESQLAKMDTQIDLQTSIRDELQKFHTDSNNWWSNWTNVTWKKEWVDTAWKKDWLATKWAKDFLSYWTDIYVKFDTYSKSTNNAYKAIDTVKDKSKKKESGDAVLALAKALTDNTADLKDPTIQSNALLSQILIVVEAILQAENTSGGASLQTSLSALGLGLTTS